MLPAGACLYLPMLLAAQAQMWPDHPFPSTQASQVEQESCITLKHSKCWNPHAELKTTREYGFGVGQLTIAYTKTGAVRFNAWAEVVAASSDLRGWKWEDRYNPEYQFKALIFKDKQCWNRNYGAANDVEHLAFAYACYNGGLGGVLADQRICAGTKGCDPSRWWANVEHASNKSKVKLPAYGNRSLFEISREYPRGVMLDRRPKYDSYFLGDTSACTSR